jgi:hypothetical protein
MTTNPSTETLAALKSAIREGFEEMIGERATGSHPVNEAAAVRALREAVAPEDAAAFQESLKDNETFEEYARVRWSQALAARQALPARF